VARNNTDRLRPSRLPRAAVAAVLAAAGVALVFVGTDLWTDDGDPAAPAHTGALAVPIPSSGASEPVTELKAVRPVADPAAGVPTGLSVPRLGIEAEVLPITVQDGILEPPSDARDVGWDTATARAGSAYGGTVITGHTVHTGGGALDELNDLRHGDAVRVTTVRGGIDYLVTDVMRVSKQAMVNQIPRLFSADVPGRLVLITCTDWNGSEYLSNTVVFADPGAAS
jgi:LPXTG-site transpeptidase (sortase) family protein